MGATKPITITLKGGEEHQLFLSLAGGQRVSDRLGGNLAVSIFKLATAVIFEAMADKGAMTIEELGEKITCDLTTLTEIVYGLLGIPLPKAGENPQLPSLLM